MSELPQWEQLPPELTEHIAADTIPIDRATELMQDRANTSASLFPLRLGPDRKLSALFVGTLTLAHASPREFEVFLRTGNMPQ